MSDLLLTTAPVDGTATVRPPVETRVTEDRLMVYLELYADDPVGLGDLRVQIDVADHASGAPLISQVGEASAADAVAARVVKAVIPVDELPAGSYVTRAIVTRVAEEVGRQTRPFEIARDPGRPVTARRASEAAEPEVATTSAEASQREEIAEARDTVAEHLTPKQRRESQQLSREWFSAHPQD